MAKFRKKPLVVEAEKFFPDRLPWPDGVYAVEPTGDYYQDQDRYCVDTLEGTVYAREGDWIITGITGEKYPCNPDIFVATYEPVVNQPVVSPAAAGATDASATNPDTTTHFLVNPPAHSTESRSTADKEPL